MDLIISASRCPVEKRGHCTVVIVYLHTWHFTAGNWTGLDWAYAIE